MADVILQNIIDSLKNAHTHIHTYILIAKQLDGEEGKATATNQLKHVEQKNY